MIKQWKLKTNNIQGEMSEWLKEHAWKACVLQKGTVGSNPTLSAFLNLMSQYKFYKRQIFKMKHPVENKL